MQNNQQNYFHSENHKPCTSNNCSMYQNCNNQQCLSSIQYPQNTCYYSEQCNYGYGCQPKGIRTNNDGYYGQCNNQGESSYYPIDCCGAKNINTVNQTNQANQYDRNGQSNLYNSFNLNNSSRLSLTNRVLNSLYNNFGNSNNHFHQQSSLFPPQTTNNTGNISLNPFKNYQRKSC